MTQINIMDVKSIERAISEHGAITRVTVEVIFSDETESDGDNIYIGSDPVEAYNAIIDELAGCWEWYTVGDGSEYDEEPYGYYISIEFEDGIWASGESDFKEYHR